MKNVSTIYPNEATVGIDLGDKWHYLCVIDKEGEVIDSLRIAAKAEALEDVFAEQNPLTVAIEAGTHSPWISRKLEAWGHRVLVGNPRKLRVIYCNDRKSDLRDAEMLARIARVDPSLLSPIHHRSVDAQANLAMIKSRDALVQSRTSLINHVRGTVKSLGARLSSCSAPSFHNKVRDEIPAILRDTLFPVLDSIQTLTEQIRAMDRKIDEACEAKYPETENLKTIRGVGSLTALAFVLTIEEASRFERSRDVPVYLGLVPRRDQSGDSDKQLRISKAGNKYLRQLLVSCAHYILGPFGEDSALRTWGLSLAERGGKNAKKRAVVATARKLAVILHSMWVSGENFRPYPNEKLSKKEDQEMKTSPSSDG